VFDARFEEGLAFRAVAELGVKALRGPLGGKDHFLGPAGRQLGLDGGHDSGADAAPAMGGFDRNPLHFGPAARQPSGSRRADRDRRFADSGQPVQTGRVEPVFLQLRRDPLAVDEDPMPERERERKLGFAGETNLDLHEPP